MMRSNTRRFNRKQLVLLVVAVVAFMLVTGLGQLLFVRQLHAWRLIPQSERFSELYFTHHDDLPMFALPDSEQRIDFTIRNVERQTTEYRYRILARAADSAGNRVLTEGVQRLAAGAEAEVTRSVTLPPLGKRVALEVQIEYGSRGMFGQDAPHMATQSIHYWVTILDAADIEEADNV